MKNTALERELNEILVNYTNLVGVSKGNIGGTSTIEIEYKEPSSHDSYMYKKSNDRDEDYNILHKSIKNYKSVKQN